MPTKKIKLLVLPSWYPPNGGSFFVNQSKWLMQEGLEVTVVSIGDRGLRHFRFRDLAGCFKPRMKEFLGIPTFRKILYRIPFLIRINEMIWIRATTALCEAYIGRYGKPDIIQAHSTMWAGVVAARMKKKFGVPFVITEHRGRFNGNSLDFKHAHASWHNAYLKEALNCADAIIPVTARMIPTLEKYAGKKLNAVSLPNPVDESLFGMKGDRDWKAIRLINISAFTSWKALDILIRAFRLAVDRQPEMELHLVGNGPEYHKIRCLVRDQHLEEEVIFHGMLDGHGVHDRLITSDIMVLSSNTEGQPVVVGESILSGVPVVATDVISEEDLPEFAGLIVEKQHPEALAEAILHVAGKLEAYPSQTIREFGLKRFSREAVTGKIIGVMRSVLTHQTAFS